MKATKYILPMALFLGVIAIHHHRRATFVQAQTQSQADADKPPSVRVNAHSRLAANNDESAINSLADEIFRDRLVTLPSALKQRIVRNEIAFRMGRGRPVKEEAIVQTLNYIATELNAPEFAKTTPGQLRHLRTQMAVLEPDFTGRSLARGNRPGKAIGSHLQSEMSPLEAAHLAIAMMEQKYNNEEYQKTPAEFVHDHYRRERERYHTIASAVRNKTSAAASNSVIASNKVESPAGASTLDVTFDSQSNNRELVTTVSQAWNSKQPYEKMKMVENSLRKLGIGE